MIKLNTIDKMTEDLGKSLIGDNIHFAWHNKEDNTIETIPAKVLECHDGKIILDTINELNANNINKHN